jgi:CheY-like chemotaxis protein
LLLIDVVAEICGGLELLEWIKAHTELHPLLIVATGRTISQPVAQTCYDLGANAVFQKPGDLEELSKLIQSLDYLPESGNPERTTDHVQK